MTKLCVEREGSVRTFRIGEGRLTVGSGAAAKLRLESPSIAEVHLELAVEEGGVRLLPRPGVVPPRIDGRAIEGEVELRQGQRVELGDAVLWIQGEGDPPQGAPGVSGAAASRPVQPTRRRRTRTSRSVVRRTKPRVQRGLPGWAIAGLVLGGVGLAVLFVWKGFNAQASQGSGPVWATIAAAREQLAAGSFEGAEKKLDGIPPGREMSAEERVEIAAIRKEIASRRAASAEAVANLSGSQFLEATLKRYEERYLKGDPDPAKIRLFLQRAAEFRRRWPTHPEMGWVDRQERRLKPLVDLAAPPSLADIEWEVKWIRAQKVRDYARAFELVDGFLAGDPDPLEAERMRALRAELVTERAEYVEDRLQQARYEYDHMGNTPRAVSWLVNLVAKSGDPEAAERAAGFLVKIPNLRGHLEAYERKYPELYRALLGNRTVREAARAAGLDG